MNQSAPLPRARGTISKCSVRPPRFSILGPTHAASAFPLSRRLWYLRTLATRLRECNCDSLSTISDFLTTSPASQLTLLHFMHHLTDLFARTRTVAATRTRRPVATATLPRAFRSARRGPRLTGSSLATRGSGAACTGNATRARPWTSVSCALGLRPRHTGLCSATTLPRSALPTSLSAPRCRGFGLLSMMPSFFCANAAPMFALAFRAVLACLHERLKGKPRASELYPRRISAARGSPSALQRASSATSLRTQHSCRPPQAFF